MTQFGLLASVRYIITPRFNLSTPLVAGLFYIAPGAGFIAGSLFGGHLSDRTVIRYIAKRDGLRIPQDRLNSGLVGLLVVLPIWMLIYGWTLEKEVGSLALPVVSAFWIGAGLMGTFNGLNTYAAGMVPLLSWMESSVNLFDRSFTIPEIGGNWGEVHDAVRIRGDQLGCRDPTHPGYWSGSSFYHM